VVPEERLVSRKCGPDSVGFLHYTSSLDASNFVCFNLPRLRYGAPFPRSGDKIT